MIDSIDSDVDDLADAVNIDGSDDSGSPSTSDSSTDSYGNGRARKCLHRGRKPKHDVPLRPSLLYMMKLSPMRPLLRP